MRTVTQNRASQEFGKLQKRLERAVNSGSFYKMAQAKQEQLLRRLQGFSSMLRKAVKPTLFTLLLSLGAQNINAQLAFNEQFASNNPLSTITSFSSPAFVDIDNDGDKDLFLGLDNGTINYYLNSGSASNATFGIQTGASNPFDTVDIGSEASPAFVDIDNDGDMDAFIGKYTGGVAFYENTGTASAHNFVWQTGANNPLNGLNPSWYRLSPSFADLDNDGDMDLILGVGYGDAIHYFQNTGTASSPVFTQQTGANNPFNGFTISQAAPSMVDVDKDGDMDAFVGVSSGDINYYRNTGTASSPAFTQQTGANNPFDGLDVGFSGRPSFVDIDNDNDKDFFVGNFAGSPGAVRYFQNNSITSIHKILTDDAITVFPNPVLTNFSLVLPAAGVYQVQITDLNGAQLYNEEHQNTKMLEINMAAWPAGVYLLQVRDERGEVRVQKLVKE